MFSKSKTNKQTTPILTTVPRHPNRGQQIQQLVLTRLTKPKCCNTLFQRNLAKSILLYPLQPNPFGFNLLLKLSVFCTLRPGSQPYLGTGNSYQVTEWSNEKGFEMLRYSGVYSSKMIALCSIKSCERGVN